MVAGLASSPTSVASSLGQNTAFNFDVFEQDPPAAAQASRVFSDTMRCQNEATWLLSSAGGPGNGGIEGTQAFLDAMRYQNQASVILQQNVDLVRKDPYLRMFAEHFHRSQQLLAQWAQHLRREVSQLEGGGSGGDVTMGGTSAASDLWGEDGADNLSGLNKRTPRGSLEGLTGLEEM
eukprot:GABV01001780.1.p1 GENE.GABV01001780.1~~GABV01001780.1.p1  ORF type:complete len:205 (-),score=62.05 GABV01001780.1:189-722(-)